MSDELKPCPFCKNRSNIKLVEYRPNCSGAVVCGQCGARGPKKKNDHERGWKVKAIEAWNTRFERTCRMEWRGEVYESEDCIEEDGSYFCTECDQELTGSLAEAWDDYQAWGYKGEQPFHHCPSCGAKVVG